ncbi:MAG: type II secretion system GspH family protein [Phycisphaerales bacterium]|nr:type II secretion system GspH family protein [Phycisphaerales bacterium]
MKSTNHRRGFTIVELMVVVAIIALLISLLVPALASSFASAKATQDQAQLRGVMAGTLMSSQDFNDKFVSPDQICRRPYTAQSTPGYMWGKGDRVINWNSTESLVSAMIMREYLEPSAFVSPVDSNPYVGAKGQIEESSGIAIPYNFDAWDPVTGTFNATGSPEGFWDLSIYCDLAPNSSEDVDHNSYANSTLCGHRLKKWNANEGHDRITWSTRGTKMGAGIGTSDYDNCPSLTMIGEENHWKGHMAHGDGSVSVETSFIPVLHYSPARGLQVVDNVFDAEFADEYFMPSSGTAQNCGAADNFLTFSNNGYASGNASQLFPGGNVLDSYLQSRCTWDIDCDDSW